MKSIRKIFALCAVTALCVTGAHGVLADGDITVMLEGNKITFTDAQPFIDENNRTQVPVRPIAEAAGCDVVWDAEAKTVSLYSDTLSCDFTVGSNIAVVKNLDGDGTSYSAINMDTEALIAADRTYIPVTYLAQALSKTADWDEETQTVNIRSLTDEEKFVPFPTDRWQPAKYFADGYADGEVPEYLSAALSRSNIINGEGYYPVETEADSVSTVDVSDSVFKMPFTFSHILSEDGEDFIGDERIQSPAFDKCEHLAVHVETDSEPVWLTVSITGITDDGWYNDGYNNKKWHKFALSKNDSVTVDFNELDPNLRYCVVVKWTPSYTPDITSVNGTVSVAAY